MKVKEEELSALKALIAMLNKALGALTYISAHDCPLGKLAKRTVDKIVKMSEEKEYRENNGG